MVAILVLMLTLLQQQFNSSDQRKAISLVGATTRGGRGSVGEELVRRSGGNSPNCQSKIVSSFRGTLEVTCTAGAQGPYRFRVDLVRNSVEPLDAATKELMDSKAQ